MEPTTLHAAIQASILCAKLIKNIGDLLRVDPKPSEVWHFYAQWAWFTHIDWTPFGPAWPGLYHIPQINYNVFTRLCDIYPELNRQFCYWERHGDKLTAKFVHHDWIGRALHPRYHQLWTQVEVERRDAYERKGKESLVYKEWLEFGKLCGWALWQDVVRRAGWPPGSHGDDYNRLYQIDVREGRNPEPRIDRLDLLCQTKIVHDALVWLCGEIYVDKDGRQNCRNGAIHHLAKVQEELKYRYIAYGLDKELTENERLEKIFEGWMPYVKTQVEKFATEILSPSEFQNMTAKLPEQEKTKYQARWYGPPVPWAFKNLALAERLGDISSPWYYAAVFPKLFWAWYPNRDSPAMMIPKAMFGV